MTLLEYRPMRSLLFVVLASFTATSGCSRDRQPTDGLPPASEWKQGGSALGAKNLPEVAPPPGMQTARGTGSVDPSDPHAGLGIDPAGMAGGAAGGADPHAGIDMTGGGAHGGGAGANVADMLPPPDPNRAIDPNRFVKGTVDIDAKAKARAKTGTPMFVVVKRADASGQPTGSPLAVDKLTWNDKAMSFELTEQQAMIAGTELTGEVIVQVRYDQDGDASSKQPGDIVGQARVKLPAENVRVVLDTIL